MAICLSHLPCLTDGRPRQRPSNRSEQEILQQDPHNIGITEPRVEEDACRSGHLRTATRTRSFILHEAEVGRLNHIANSCLPRDGTERLRHQSGYKAGSQRRQSHHDRGGCCRHKDPSQNCNEKNKHLGGTSAYTADTTTSAEVPALEGLPRIRNRDGKEPITCAAKLKALHEGAQTRRERGLGNNQ